MIQNYCFVLLFVCLTCTFINGETTSQPNVIVRVSNMTESMKQDAVRITKQAFIKFNGYSEKSRSTLAKYIRFEFDKLYTPSWQCILGKDFALSITTENQKRIILDVGKVAVLIFKGKC
ncbi:unnamed protein product [Adineta steineri]|uniref:Dynein light chain n=1 Tax=Adineta steineri TaxID=433720 RepID=A0A815FNA5_9BILA|nr:unnamed protein product [Adineta steineri]CAF3901500.1 unnamed protein product [Adineta steineri]